MIKKLNRRIKKIFSAMPLDERVAEISNKLMDGGIAPALYSKRIAVEGVEDSFFFGLFSFMVRDLRKSESFAADIIQVRSINGAIGVGVISIFFRSWLCTFLSNNQWARANRNLIGCVAYRSQPVFWRLGRQKDRMKAEQLWIEMKTLEYPEKLYAQDIQIGDLVIDSYLRFKPSPRFDVEDPFVFMILQQAVRDLTLAKNYFLTRKPVLYLSSYSTYIEHGIPVRVALSLGIIVRTYGNIIAFGKKLSLEDFFHTADTSKYSHEFYALSEGEKKVAIGLADRELNLRLSGGIDPATSYMKRSAYVRSGEEVPDVAGAVVIFLHDFYDSPHVYPDLIFTDFWNWISFTIQVLLDSEIPFWIKPHPNQISLSEGVLIELKQSFPNARFLSSKITNIELIEAGIICGVTAYGTVAHELAYFGVPSICCATHPHASFHFCRTAKSISEYRDMLLTPSLSPLSPVDMRLQALAFYFMHNLYGPREKLMLKQANNRVWKSFGDYDSPAMEALEALSQLSYLPGWRQHMCELKKDLCGLTSS
jgi:hypothetical protein